MRKTRDLLKKMEICLFFSRLSPGPHPNPSALRRKPWGGPRGPRQPTLLAVQPPSPHPSTPHFFSVFAPSPPTATVTVGSLVPCCWQT